MTINAVAVSNYVAGKEIKYWVIEQPFYTRLNKLKRSNMEAFFIGLGFLNWGEEVVWEIILSRI